MFFKPGRWLTILAALLMTAFAAPQKGDLIEIEQMMNARSNAKFRATDNNRVKTLKSQTRAHVEEVKRFLSGNYGLKLRIINGDASETVWVHYDPKKTKNPAVRLFSVAGNREQKEALLARWQTDSNVQAAQTKDPEKATGAVVTRPTPAVVEPPADGIPAATAQDITKLTDINKVVQPSAADCNCTMIPEAKPVQPVTYKQCGDNDSYLQNRIVNQEDPNWMELLAPVTPEFQGYEGCIKGSMATVQSNGLKRFAQCSEGQREAQMINTAACTSEQMVRVVQNAFVNTTDCLGEYVTGSEGSTKELFNSAFALINQESGFQVNVASPGRALGLGQITYAATAEINRPLKGGSRWDRMISQIHSSNKLSCQSLQRTTLNQARALTGYQCDRLGINNGSPAVNMLYTLGHMKMIRDSVLNTLNDEAREDGLQISPQARNKIADALMVWGHNTGGNGINTPLKRVLDTAAGRAALKSVETGSLDQLFGLLRSEVADYHFRLTSQGLAKKRAKQGSQVTAEQQAQDLKKARRRSLEASGFYTAVLEKHKKLESNTGLTCTR